MIGMVLLLLLFSLAGFSFGHDWCWLFSFAGSFLCIWISCEERKDQSLVIICNNAI